MKDELLGLAADPYADSVFRNQHINMDVFYRTGETQQVHIFILNHKPSTFSFNFIEFMLFTISTVVFLFPL